MWPNFLRAERLLYIMKYPIGTKMTFNILTAPADGIITNVRPDSTQPYEMKWTDVDRYMYYTEQILEDMIEKGVYTITFIPEPFPEDLFNI